MRRRGARLRLLVLLIHQRRLGRGVRLLALAPRHLAPMLQALAELRVLARRRALDVVLHRLARVGELLRHRFKVDALRLELLLLQRELRFDLRLGLQLVEAMR